MVKYGPWTKLISVTVLKKVFIILIENKIIMAFNLYRNRNCLTKIDKFFFHNHYRVIKNEIKKCQGNEQDFFSLSLEKHTSFQVSLTNILIFADTLYFLVNPQIEAPGVDWSSSTHLLKSSFVQQFLTFFLTFLLPTVTFGFVLLFAISKGRKIFGKMELWRTYYDFGIRAERNDKQCKCK